MANLRRRQLSSKAMQGRNHLLRNLYSSSNEWNIPDLKKVDIEINDVKLIAADRLQKVRNADRSKFVHFFLNDLKLETYYNKYIIHPTKLALFAGVLTPDFSLYRDMPLAVQMMNTFKNRWCGAFWQEWGFTVIPTMSWSTEESYKFCFLGVPQQSVVAISSVGVLGKDKEFFLSGYREMMKRLQPKTVICQGRPFVEAEQNTIFVPYDYRGGRD